MARSTDFARFILLLCISIMNSSAKVIILPHRKKFEKNIFAKKELIFRIKAENSTEFEWCQRPLAKKKKKSLKTKKII